MPSIEKSKFVITGGASQVGLHIADHLLAGGAREVVLLDNLSLGTSDAIQPLLSDNRCRFIRGDVLRLNELFDAFENADGVFAVAALMASSISKDPWVGVDVNVRGIQNTLEACRYRGVKKLILSSSAGVYGTLDGSLTHESQPLRWEALGPAISIYCASKVMGESLARFHCERYGTDFVALRYTSVYGERQHKRAVVAGHIADTCERIRNGLPPMLDGDGSQVSDYVYVGDVARANLLAMQSDLSGESINICSGVETTQSDIVRIAIAASGSKLQAESRANSSRGFLPPATRQILSREKAKVLLGWEPQVSIENGVERVLRWVDSQRLKCT